MRGHLWRHHIGRAAAMLILAVAGSTGALADVIKVAVAANFTEPAREIATAFEAATGNEVLLSFGSTAKLFTQIANGAPFEVFLAADAKTPDKAEAEGVAVPGTRFTYAVGRLVLYSSDPALVDGTPAVLSRKRFGKLAIGNPATAPYGAAAVEVMQKLGLYETLKPRLVMGENVGQAYQFVATGNAELGFVSASQVVGAQGSRWEVPADFHSPLRQDAVLTKAGAESEAAKSFLAFLDGEMARAIIARFGYGLEED